MMPSAPVRLLLLAILLLPAGLNAGGPAFLKRRDDGTLQR
jgi:hypothetical protein